MEVEQFMHTMQEFLSSLKEVYPECLKVRGYEYMFRKQVSGVSGDRLRDIGQRAVKGYDEIMSPWYERCARRDEGLLSENIKFLHDIDLPAKWKDMDGDTRDTIWEYITRLNHFCGAPDDTPEAVDIDNLQGMPEEMSSLLSMMPHSLKVGISATSAKYASRIKSGEMTFSDVNVMQIAEEVGSAINQEDLQAFGATLESGDVNTASLMSMVSQMGSDEIPSGMMAAITGLLPKK